MAVALGTLHRANAAGSSKLRRRLSMLRKRQAEESSMAANDQYFVPPEATQTLLRARGFSASGQRSGGIASPQIVDLPAGTVLFRMYHDPTKAYANGGPRRVSSP
jgi:hypothetical protein